MSTSSLLQSRAHHQHVRVLSRKARESEIDRQDPPSRQRPLPPPDHTEQLSNCQRSQREQRRKEREVRLNDVVDVSPDLSNIFSHSSVAENIIQQTGTRIRRKNAQKKWWLREKTMAARVPCDRHDGMPLVSTYQMAFPMLR